MNEFFWVASKETEHSQQVADLLNFLITDQASMVSFIKNGLDAAPVKLNKQNFTDMSALEQKMWEIVNDASEFGNFGRRRTEQF